MQTRTSAIILNTSCKRMYVYQEKKKKKKIEKELARYILRFRDKISVRL